jgi:formylglycine-generating enzyme required for sulfatase activity
MVVIPSGEFWMGSSDSDRARDVADASKDSPGNSIESVISTEQPHHLVAVNNVFGLAIYPVTRREFSVFVGETEYSPDGDCTEFVNHRYITSTGSSWKNPGFLQSDDDPVVCVSWKDAEAYIT